MAREDGEEARRRHDAEEEQQYWDSIEDEKCAEEERAAERREAAIEVMEKWFFEQFEDPQSETPRDSEDQVYVYVWGGPFEAPHVLHGQFSADYDQSVITAAVERIERDGTTEWAPTSTGDYYEHPDPEPEEAGGEDVITVQLTAQILDRLAKLEETVAALPGLPGNIGHNAPPDDIGLPPYGEDEAAGVAVVIAETRAELAQPVPDAAKLATFARRFDRWGAKIGAWLAKKGDLAVDELIKSAMKVAPWSVALSLYQGLAHDLLELVRHLLARF